MIYIFLKIANLEKRFHVAEAKLRNLKNTQTIVGRNTQAPSNYINPVIKKWPVVKNLNILKNNSWKRTEGILVFIFDHKHSNKFINSIIYFYNLFILPSFLFD